MISLRIELDFFRAGMARLIALESGDLAEQFDAELRVEQLQQLRLRMRGQNGLKPELQTQREGIES